jgi:exodeoxyribonuclease VII large subunit
MSKILSVSEINEYIKKLLDGDHILSSVFVKGELSNYKTYPSGHHYFTMKDSEGALRCVMFKSSAQKLKYRPESGMSAVAFGRISVYPRDGAYQLYVEELIADGVGQLYYAYEKLKEKLQKEGLFDAGRKKPLPKYPKAIAVITSAAGAAAHDIFSVLKTRWPLTKVYMLPVRVQGTEAPPEICAAIEYCSAHKLADIIITGRGGGSIEDLWAFNDEKVVRAIAASEIPVISAVGHEPDVTLSDFAADVRAATPSNAAEIAVPDIVEVLEIIKMLKIRQRQAITGKLKALQRRLDEISGKAVMKNPKNYIENKRMYIDQISDKLSRAMKEKSYMRREKFAKLSASLVAMNPLEVLSRGYAIAQFPNGKVIKGKKDVKAGQRIIVKLKNDEISCIVQ